MKNAYPKLNPKTVVIGIGNPILSDDGLGIKAVNILRSFYADKRENTGDGSCVGFMEFTEASTGGINLMEHMAGFQRAIVIDSIVTGRHKAGTVFKFIYPDIPYTRNTVSTHDMDLPAAIEIGRYLGISLPSEIIIFAVEARDVANFGEVLTEEVEAAIKSVVSEIQLMLGFR